MDGIYIIADGASRTFGCAISSASDKCAKRSFAEALAHPDVPDYVADDVVLYKLGELCTDDYDNPYIIPRVATVVARGSQGDIKDYIRSTRKAFDRPFTPLDEDDLGEEVSDA